MAAPFPGDALPSSEACRDPGGFEMRIGSLLLPLVAIASAASAHAQGGAQPNKATAATGTMPKADCRGTREEIRACGEAWFKDCLKDWDKGTHMSKTDYARTCRRVVDNRVKALIDEREKEAAQKRTSAGQRP